MSIQEKTSKNDKEKQIIHLIKDILGDNFKKKYSSISSNYNNLDSPNKRIVLNDINEVFLKIS